jgi:hypothetical protein
VKSNSGSNVSRRTLLKSAAVGGLIIPGGAAALAQETSRLSFNPRQWTFSPSERDRRWAAVRAIMARPQWNLDAIITAQSDLSGNTARYLTQIGMRPRRRRSRGHLSARHQPTGLRAGKWREIP